MTRDLYREVTGKILEQLIAGVVPWKKPWSATPGLNVPCNAVTNRAYNGVNVILLWIARDKGWPTPRFLTFRQALAAGGHVRKGEHGTGIVFVKDLKYAEPNGDDADAVRSVRLLRYFTVFNVAQCDDLPARITDPPIARPRHHDGHDPLIDEFIATTGARIREGGDAAFIPSIDAITMPPFASFIGASAFYGVLFHELAHWTGHASRLDRDPAIARRFDRAAHAAEELIAELAAAFLCAEFSIDGDPRMSGYIKHYIALLEHDAKAFFTAASKAQAAVDYLRDLALREPLPPAADTTILARAVS